MSVEGSGLTGEQQARAKIWQQVIGAPRDDQVATSSTIKDAGRRLNGYVRVKGAENLRWKVEEAIGHFRRQALGTPNRAIASGLLGLTIVTLATEIAKTFFPNKRKS